MAILCDRVLNGYSETVFHVKVTTDSLKHSVTVQTTVVGVVIWYTGMHNEIFHVEILRKFTKISEYFKTAVRNILSDVSWSVSAAAKKFREVLHQCVAVTQVRFRCSLVPSFFDRVRGRKQWPSLELRSGLQPSSSPSASNRFRWPPVA